MAIKAKSNPLQIKANKSDNLMTALGISTKRAEELKKITLKKADCGRISELLAYMSKHCKNSAELAVSSFIAGEAIEKTRTYHKTQMLNMMFKNFLKK